MALRMNRFLKRLLQFFLLTSIAVDFTSTGPISALTHVTQTRGQGKQTSSEHPNAQRKEEEILTSVARDDDNTTDTNTTIGEYRAESAVDTPLPTDDYNYYEFNIKIAPGLAPMDAKQESPITTDISCWDCDEQKGKVTLRPCDRWSECELVAGKDV
ncbi:uncharacterized protein LOC103522571 [Diaphorina citri]|uniref:Uncharacterized protein LOC103522571 n=1 Tax=Diaphorina citri TaxID=121845 RepID=A0A1S3DRE8_DIACI|nr:uncharacterized protein LOC103522571 [Diaphorina citri]